ncbi:hypothetical protein ACWGII_10600 [Streptomyces sp. NPDC054855]
MNQLIADNGFDMQHLDDAMQPFQEIEFLTVNVASGLPEAACLSCQSVLVRLGAADLSQGL